MFERRLKVFLFVLAVVTAVLVGRAVDLQILGREHWVEEAAKSLHHDSLTETTRGRLLDVRGRPLAEDMYCFDACVDYRAIPKDPDEQWVHEIAVARVKEQHEKTGSTRVMVKDEVTRVKADIDRMWERLAEEGGMSQDQMDDLRQSIVQDVEMRRRYTWYRNYQRAQKGGNTTEPAVVEPWYRKWLMGGTDVSAVDTFDITIGEQTQPHVILRAISSQVYNELGKEQEHFPGLVLSPGMERSYPLPYGEAACHVLGRLTRVDADDLKEDPWVGDDLRAYKPSDLIGRGGLEALCEPLLRGSRGRVDEWSSGESEEPSDASPGQAGGSREEVVDAVPGQDVKTTIDVDLEQDIRSAFNHVNVKREKTDPDLFADLHGAAVAIDVATGEVRAMVSAPGFDPNIPDRDIAALNDDDLNKPMFNRATFSMLETGSTIKPVVGIGAITQGVMGINDTIECTGFLTIQGKEVPGGARCWTLSKFGFDRSDPRASHHRIPFSDPHPTGFLTFSDALQRSCNVFFENMGYRLGVDGLSKWMRKFGLGQITGIGIPEVRGRLPDLIPAKDIAARSVNALWGGIGQGCVGATPIQMANVAATIARNGIWLRPRLVTDDVSRQLRAIAARHPSTQPSWTNVPDGPVDLQLSPQAVAAAQEGMWRVVNTIAGTGNELFRGDLQISGKTGTAQATPFSIPIRDRFGREIYDGKKVKTFYPQPSTPDKPNPLAPWYLGFEEKGSDKIELKHSWYIGFAPSHNPKIAFAVLVEYGGSGGSAAGTIAKRIVDECVEHGYVPLDTQTREQVP
jgi:penicillin-binding protein 2